MQARNKQRENRELMLKQALLAEKDKSERLTQQLTEAREEIVSLKIRGAKLSHALRYLSADSDPDCMLV